MKDLNYVAGEIVKGHNLKVNVSKYATGMSSMYASLAYMKFSMNYYTLYDMERETPAKSALFDELFGKFHGLVEPIMCHNDKEREQELLAIKQEVQNATEILTQYLDCMLIYEYVLNRVEHRFSGKKPDKEYYGMYMTNDIMHYILSERDNVVINSKIAEIVGQLPMRLSRERFYNYLREAFTLYHGAQKGTVDDFAYALRTSATLLRNETYATAFPELADICASLEHADYAALTAEEYQRLRDILTIGSEKASENADLFVMLASVINDMYTVLLTAGDTLSNVSEIDMAKDIITEIAHAIEHHEDVAEEVLDKFTMFEGKQEKILMITSKSDYAIDTALEKLTEELRANEQIEVFEKLSSVLKLQSGSEFVDLHKKPELEEVAEDEYIHTTCEKLIADLTSLFQNKTQIVRRAVMSSLLAQLPVFFNNTDEICDYINLSLEQCHDEAEQMAVIEVVKMITEGN